MCGIIGVAGGNGLEAFPILLKGLRLLEYRGYDSYGFALLSSNPGLTIQRAIGQIGQAIIDIKTDASSGIAHTRWATHGGVTEYNAHPQISCNKHIAVVHNGILTNYLELRDHLKSLGHEFSSETDTEVISHLIEEYMKTGYEFFQAVQMTVKDIGSEGSYAFACVCEDVPNTIAFAKNRSPLIVGLGDNLKENFVASAEVAFLEYTRKYIALEDMSVGQITPTSVEIYGSDGKLLSLEGKIQVSQWTIEEAQKGGFKHFMLKEIHEQSHAIRNTLQTFDINALKHISESILTSSEIWLLATGTSLHSCMIGEYLLEKLAHVRARAILPSVLESKGIIPGSLIIAVSQSGETADTIRTIDYGRKNGAIINSIVNNVGTQIPRMSSLCLYTHAGPEIGVAATKTFSTQILALTRIAIEVGRMKNIITDRYEDLLAELHELPEIVNSVIKRVEYLAKNIGGRVRYRNSIYYLGSSTTVPLAMEGALKLKEIAYVHAEGYNAAESKHGPIALIEPGFPIIFIAANDETTTHLIGNIKEMSARGAFTIVIHEGDERLERIADLSVSIPKLRNKELAFIPLAVVLQMIAYYTAAGKIINGAEINPDKPRNLAKSVTVS